ncbi:MAPEG family protein [Thioclava sp. GXIMD4216]|uniref:MAPEG family protein n=1 Tax=Thioclava litoralis TaxID=3076557 RepID=A0ABZ1DXH8_9RHOB|nr:MAPEG family protein [Thioclava sp. FTW29]
MIEFTTPELSALGLAVLLHIALMVLFAVRANLELPRGYALSPRDTPPAKPLSVVTARLQRAMNNSFESLILFTPAVLLVVLTRQTGPLTTTLCGIFLVARFAFIPAYALGWTPWRSLFWGIGLLATLAVLLIGLI